jgi:hypothetical protein
MRPLVAFPAELRHRPVEALDSEAWDYTVGASLPCSEQGLQPIGRKLGGSIDECWNQIASRQPTERETLLAAKAAHFG